MRKNRSTSRARYTGKSTVWFRMDIRGEDDVFIDDDIVEEVLYLFKGTLIKNKCMNLIYLFLPRSFEFIIRGTSQDSDSLQAAGSFKQKSGFRLKKNLGVHWSREYTDRILPSDAGIKDEAEEIMEQITDAELAQNWRQYPYIGSVHQNLEDLLAWQ